MKFMPLGAFVMGERRGALLNDSLFICEDLALSALGAGYLLIHSAPPLLMDAQPRLAPTSNYGSIWRSTSP